LNVDSSVFAGQFEFKPLSSPPGKPSARLANISTICLILLPPWTMLSLLVFCSASPPPGRFVRSSSNASRPSRSGARRSRVTLTAQHRFPQPLPMAHRSLSPLCTRALVMVRPFFFFVNCFYFHALNFFRSALPRPISKRLFSTSHCNPSISKPRCKLSLVDSSARRADLVRCHCRCRRCASDVGQSGDRDRRGHSLLPRNSPHRICIIRVVVVVVVIIVLVGSFVSTRVTCHLRCLNVAVCRSTAAVIIGRFADIKSIACGH
jgi:hypothetical protein